MFEHQFNTTRISRPQPMAELTVGGFAMEVGVMRGGPGGLVARPVALIAICRNTLMAAGVRVAHEAVSYNDVLRCLADSFLPKDASVFGSSGFWPCEGVAERVFVHARHNLTPAPVRRFREALGVKILRYDNSEPLVTDLAERWSQEMGLEVDPLQDGYSALSHSLAGRVPKGDPVPLNEIDRWLRRWIVDRYHSDPVPGIERSPLDLWREAAATFVPRFVPADAPGDLFRPEMFRPIGPHGVVWGGRTYWSEAISHFAERVDEAGAYEVRADPKDPRSIEILTRERKWLRLHARWV